MTQVMDYQETLVFDIETVALAEAEHYLEDATAPANYKDPAKIAAYLADAQTKALEKAALDPDLCRIVALGVSGTGFVFERAHHIVGDDGCAVEIMCDESDEAVALQRFWGAVRTARLVGFNCLAFDLPVLLRRSLYLGVTPCIDGSDLNKYRMSKVLDLMQLLSFSGVCRQRSLDFYCRRLGIDVPDEHTGKDIEGLVADGDWDAIAAHCRADVERTVQLAQRMGVLETSDTSMAAPGR